MHALCDGNAYGVAIRRAQVGTARRAWPPMWPHGVSCRQKMHRVVTSNALDAYGGGYHPKLDVWPQDVLCYHKVSTISNVWWCVTNFAALRRAGWTPRGRQRSLRVPRSCVTLLVMRKTCPRIATHDTTHHTRLRYTLHAMASRRVLGSQGEAPELVACAMHARDHTHKLS